MKNLLKYTLLLFLPVLAACSNDEEWASVAQQPHGALELSVGISDFTTYGSAPNTRATDNGATTTFENGDRIGIIVLDNSNNIVYDNIPYKYNGNTWSFDSDNGEDKTAVYYDNKATAIHYIAYFPYSKEADGVTGEDALKAKFPPLSDQRTKVAYRASDLLVWSKTTTGSEVLKKLEIAFTHAYSLLLLSPSIRCKINGVETSYVTSAAEDVSFTIQENPHIAYRADDGSYRIIVSPQTTDARWFYSYDSKTYSGTMASTELAENNRYTVVASALDIGNYTFDKVQVGDFYCKNDKGEGYLIPREIASLTKEQQATCIGIVYCTDVNRIGSAATEALKGKGVTPHGLVMALTNASDGCRWGIYGNDENSRGSGPFKDDTDNLKKQYGNVDGYGETQWIINTYGKEGNNALQNAYTAFFHAGRYGTAASNTEKYAAPANTTGWFIPSMGQWWDILSGLGGIDLSDYRNSTKGYASISGAAPTAVENMNKYLRKISDATTFRMDTYFWSSSERHSFKSCYVCFYSDGDLDLDSYYKDYGGSRVRCSFAF